MESKGIDFPPSLMMTAPTFESASMTVPFAVAGGVIVPIVNVIIVPSKKYDIMAVDGAI